MTDEKRNIKVLEARIDYLAAKVANSSEAAKTYHMAELKALRWIVGEAIRLELAA